MDEGFYLQGKYNSGPNEGGWTFVGKASGPMEREPALCVLRDSREYAAYHNFDIEYRLVYLAVVST